MGTNKLKKMRFFYLIISLLTIGISYSQNVKMEITEYHKKMGEKRYSSYHFVQASYSYSRAYILLITNDSIFEKLHLQIPSFYRAKQEYTDVYMLGIKDLDFDNPSKEGSDIINTFYDTITSYRKNNNLLYFDKKYFESNTHFLKYEADIKRYLMINDISNR